MSTASTTSLHDLYLQDETAWLETMAELVRRRKLEDLDLDNLAEYLTDMAKRDRREVRSRLIVLLVRLLKWEFQKEKRTRSWNLSIIQQRRKLADAAATGVLRAHAEAVLPAAYKDALEQAAVETGLPESSFPPACPYTVAELLEIRVK